MNITRLSTLSLILAIAAVFTLGLAAAPALANPADSKGCHDHKPCVSDPEPSGGNKGLLFEINFADVQTCGGATDLTRTDPTGDSNGQVSWAGNVLWDPNNIHVHLKLQLKNVEPGEYGPILGGNDIDCKVSAIDDIPLCGGGDCEPNFITVKQKRQGRTSGALRLPGCHTDETTTVWVTVTVDDGAGGDKILRSAPVTVVLPPNEVGTGTPPGPVCP